MLWTIINNAVVLDRYPLVIASRYNIPYLLDVPGSGEFVVGEVYAIDDEKVRFIRNM